MEVHFLIIVWGKDNGASTNPFCILKEGLIMAHIQSKPVHDSEAQHKKNFQAVNAKSPAADSSHRSHQTEATHADNTLAHRPIEEASHEFEILGCPWQFVAVIGAIAVGILGLVLKSIGLF